MLGTKVLADNLIQGHPYTTGDKLADKFEGGDFQLMKVVVADNFITWRGLGVSFEFALTIAKYLLSDNQEKVDRQANHIYFDH